MCLPLHAYLISEKTFVELRSEKYEEQEQKRVLRSRPNHICKGISLLKNPSH